ncbi:MAG: putative MATE family efflux protein [Psychromonas sp.]|jgi:putative MATE family efflux protein|uniref:MATE family efflux transporter n=1 Tax=Psychromonas sp. TaxID=1884585 RepID=UPI0039E3A77D
MNRTETIALARDIFKQTWPMVFGIFSLMSFQLADSTFISQLGVLPLAAQGFTMPLQMVIIGLQVGLGIATTAVISRILGQKDDNRARQIGGLVFMVGAVGVFVMALIIWFMRVQILTLLGAPAEVTPYINQYWPVWLCSAWLGAMLYFAYSICRSHGNTFLPGILMMATSIINIALDPLFIFYFDLGLLGAAVATICSFTIGLLIILPKLTTRNWLSFDWQSLQIWKSIQEINAVMTPAMMSQLLPPLSSVFATKIVASFGAAAVAGWAMVSRIEFFTIVVVLALTMSLPPMIGRLFGAKDCKTIINLVKMAVIFTVILQVILAVLLFIFAAPLAAFFSADSQVESVIYQYLLVVPVSLSSLGVCMLMVSICNSLAMSMRALLISTLRLFVCYLPLVWIASELWQLEGVFIGAMLGNLLAGLMAWGLYHNAIKKMRSNAAGFE